MPVSAEFERAIVQSHEVDAFVRILDGNTGDVLQDGLRVSNGGVDLDAQADIRGHTDLTINDPDLIPQEATDLLAPYGNEIQVVRGIRFPSGDSELVSLGIFRIDESQVTDTGESVEILVNGQDRAAKVDDANFEEPYEVAAGTLATTAILDLVQYAIPNVVYNFAATDVALPKLIAEEGDSRWAMARGIATALGGELFFDQNGELVLQPVPSPADDPDYYLTEGEGGVLLLANPTWSRVNSHNRWIITGENSTIAEGTALPRGVATDDNPISPTYYGGPFGKVPKFEQSEFLTTPEQAQDMAEGMKAKEIGTTKSINFGQVVDPRRGPSDVVRITRSRLGIDEAHVIDSVSIPLGAEDSMTGVTRSVQVQ